jgi:alpha-tubulin suppressor-like RCC1 family protein
MAETIAIWLITALVPAGATGAVVVSMTTLAIVTGIVKFVGIVALSMAASKLLTPKMPSFADSLGTRGQMVRSPISARQIIYGKAKVSGTIVYIQESGTKNEYLNIVIAIAGHEVEEIGDVYLNEDVVLTGAGDGSATGKYAGHADIYKKLGAPGQTAFSALVTETSTATVGKWTNDHKLTGVACVYVRLKWNSQIFVGGIPNVSCMVKGKKVFDPRTSTTGYSTNPALCLRDYLTSPLGLQMASSEIDDSSFIVAANVCDEQVQILPLSPTTYENRYEANGSLTTSDSPESAIGKLLSAMAGLCSYSGGKLVLYAGTYQIPTVTFTEKHFVGPISVTTKTSARDRVNTVKGVFVSEKNQWQVSDFPVVTSTTYVTEDANIKYTRDVVLPFTISPSCAQRLAVIELRRARQEIVLSARLRLEAMQIRAGETVKITNAKFGWVDKVFEVMEWKFASDGSPPQLAVDMTLREIDSTVYSWAVGDEIAVTAAPNTNLPDPFSVTAPTNLFLVADGTTQLYQGDGTALPRIRVSWSAPNEEFVRAGGYVSVEWKNTAATTYLEWSRVPGDQTTEFIDGVIIDEAYDVRIYAESYFGVSSTYVVGSVTVFQDTVAPSIPTGLTATLGTGRAISLDWDDNTEPDFSEYGVWRNTSGTTPGSYSNLYTTGYNRYGALGLGDTTQRNSFVQLAGNDWASVGIGSENGYGIKNDGTLWAWGYNNFGQLGLGDTTNRSSPVQVGALTDWKSVKSFWNFVLATKTNDTLWAWGRNSYGQLGLGDTTDRSSPVQVGALTNWSKLACADEASFAIKTDGTLWSWGRSLHGQLGLGAPIVDRSSPVQVGAFTDWVRIVAGAEHGIGTRSNGSILTWGRNQYGQLGHGDLLNRSSPTQVGALTNWSIPSSGNAHTVAVKTDGTLWTWGLNQLGQLGQGVANYLPNQSPLQVGSLTNWKDVSAAAFQTIATKTDGTLWSWGWNQFGQLGLGNTTNRSSPVQVGSLTSWGDIAAGGYGTYAFESLVVGTKIAETRASRFVDTEVLPGVTYYYWINAYDRLENVSGFSNRADATPSSVTAGGVDNTPPANPSALTSITSSLYIGSDGGARALVVVTVPALPARGTMQNVLYRRQNTSGSYEIAAQISNTVPVSAVIDDLTPGITYDIASQAWSFSNIPSAVITAAFSPFVATQTPAPAAPTGGTLSKDGVQPKYFPGTEVFLFGTRIGWAPNTEKDFSYYEIKATTTNSDGATDYSWTPYDGANSFVQTRDTECFLYNPLLNAGHVRIRAVNRTGAASAWAYLGNANAIGNASIGIGDMAAANKVAVTIDGGRIKIPTGGQRGFEANVGSNIDVLGVDFRVFNTSTVEKFRVDDATGQVLIDNTKVLSTRYATAPVTLADVIAVLQHHGLAP